jgi:hypothetical protein
MALKPLWTGSQLLRKLLDDFLSGKLKTDTFCRDVEVAYNGAIDEAALTAVEQPIFEKLFNIVVWYSPIPEERAELPLHLKNDQQVRDAALATEAELRQIG